MLWPWKKLWTWVCLFTGLVLLLVVMVWTPGVLAQAPEKVVGGGMTVLSTPTEDSTVTALSKEKLGQEVLQLREQNDPDFFEWLRTNASIFLSTLAVVLTGLIGLGRWLADRRNEREKRAEERFQTVVIGLDDDKERVRNGAAILLRTFLRPGYAAFFVQVFDLAVAHLRLSSDADSGFTPPSQRSETLIGVFKEAFPLARATEHTSDQSLDARGVHLDDAFLKKADLRHAWMPWASLRNVDLSGADLREANLDHANLSGANLSHANLSGASVNGIILTDAKLFQTNLSGLDLTNVNLARAELSETNLRGATLTGAILTRAIFPKADLTGAHLMGVNMSGVVLCNADLSHANLEGSVLTKAQLQQANLTGADVNLVAFNEANCVGATFREVKNLASARWLTQANLRGVKGLTQEQRDICQAKGALLDEPVPMSSILAPASPPLSPDAQDALTPPRSDPETPVVGFSEQESGA